MRLARILMLGLVLLVIVLGLVSIAFVTYGDVYFEQEQQAQRYCFDNGYPNYEIISEDDNYRVYCSNQDSVIFGYVILGEEHD